MATSTAATSDLTRVTVPATAQAGCADLQRTWLTGRILRFALVLAIELACYVAWKFLGPSRWIDAGIPLVTGLQSAALIQSFALFVLTSTILLFASAWPKLRGLPSLPDSPYFARRAWCGHLLALITFLLVPVFVPGSQLGSSGRFAFEALRWALLVSALILGGLSFAPIHVWTLLIRLGGTKVWIYGAIIVFLTGPSTRLIWSFWNSAANLTFEVVVFLLRPVRPEIFADANSRILGTTAFQIRIKPVCSGLEGVLLVLLFGVFWLALFRRDYRFPRALFLVPAAVTAAWVLNSLRIALLFLVGDAGFPNIALGGFHSEAGWLSFILVAFLIFFGLGRLPTFLKLEPASSPRVSTSVLSGQHFSAPYLMPFMATLAAGILSGLVTADFEWLYPLRFFVTAAALWWYRARLRDINFSISWLAPLTGLVVFLIWIAIDWAFPQSSGQELRHSIDTLPLASRYAWIALRVLASVITVPVAEELAFRGFLARRLVSADFEAVPYQTLTFKAAILSSAVFGALHGDRWFAGLLAGLLYTVLVRRTGRLGDAIAAHAITNALIAGCVLTGNRWQLW